MNIYEDRNSIHRRGPACSYCRKADHTVRDCPCPEEDWVHLSKFKIPINETNITSNHWFKQPRYWGEWYEKCQNALARQEQHKRLKKAPRPARSAPACGFCRDHGHNRRNCPKMATFLAACKKANVNYRKAVHEIVVKDLGLDVGAAIELEQRGYYGAHPETFVGLITQINWDKINVMTAYNSHWNDNNIYGQDMNITALVDGEEQLISLELYDPSASDFNNVVKRKGGRWHSLKLKKIVGKSDVPLSEDWATSYNDAWEYLVKKRTLSRLKEDCVYSHIMEWANKDI